MAVKKNTRERTAEIIRILDKTYPNVVCALHHNNAWELLVATILSAQCTDVRVNLVTPGLFAKYPTIQDFAAARQEVLANDIRSTGFFNNKAKSVIGAAKKILKDYNGEVREDARRTNHRARSGAQDRQCGARHRLRHQFRHRSRYPRPAYLEPTRADQKLRPRKNRAGPDENHPARTLDPVLAPTHPLRPRHLHRTQTQMRRMPALRALLVRGQNRVNL